LQAAAADETIQISAEDAAKLRIKEGAWVRVTSRRGSVEPKRLDKALLVKRKQGGFDLVRDLHDLWLLVNESMMSLNVLEQAARALRDEEFLDALKHMQDRNEAQDPDQPSGSADAGRSGVR
jgi:hypothetical protein